MLEGILRSHSDSRASGSKACAPRVGGRGRARGRHTVTRRCCRLPDSGHFNLRAWGPAAVAAHSPPPPPRPRCAAPAPTRRHTGGQERTPCAGAAGGSGHSPRRGARAGVARGPGRGEGPWGGPGGAHLYWAAAPLWVNPK